MDIISITWSTWGKGALDIQTYLGDVYLPTRTLIAIILVVVGVKIYKRKKTSK